MDNLGDKLAKEALYREQSAKKAKEDLRDQEMAWKDPKCRAIYDRLLAAVDGGPSAVRSGMRGRAKQMAISAYRKGIEPDTAKFVAAVKVANAANERHKKNKD